MFIGERIFNAVAHASLRREMHHTDYIVIAYKRLHLVGIGNVHALKGEAVDPRKGRQPRLF